MKLCHGKQIYDFFLLENQVLYLTEVAGEGGPDLAPQNLAQNFRKCSFNLAGSESGEKSRRTKFFAYISQLFVYKTCLWT